MIHIYIYGNYEVLLQYKKCSFGLQIEQKPFYNVIL